MTFKQAFLVGLAQIGALIPGFAQRVDDDRRQCGRVDCGEGCGVFVPARYAIIFAAGVLELPKLFHARDQLADALLGGVLTAIAAYLSVRFLMRYFEGRGRLASFGLYFV